MGKATYIDANEFLETLKANGLVIVSVKEYEATKDMQRKKLMRRKALTLSEIANNRLLPVGTKKAVNDWILSGKIKPNETYRETTGKKRVMVLTSAIKRLGYDD